MPRDSTATFDIGVLIQWLSAETISTIRLPRLDDTSELSWSLWGCRKLLIQNFAHIVAASISPDLANQDPTQHSLILSHRKTGPFAVAQVRNTKARGILRVFTMSPGSQVFAVHTTFSYPPYLKQLFSVVAAVSVDQAQTCSDRKILLSIDGQLMSTVYLGSLACSIANNRIIFSNPEHRVVKLFRRFINDTIERARGFLEARAGELDSVTNTGLVIGDNFAQLLILEATNQRSLAKFVDHAGKWNFFRGKPILAPEDFPPDFDTTSIAMTVLKRDADLANSVMDDMLQYRDQNGILLTYFDHSRPRQDPVVCINALSFFYSRNRGPDLEQTLFWVHDVLLRRSYANGTRYYETAECFLYFLSRLLVTARDESLRALLESPLKERLKERIGAPGDATALSMRVMACANVGLQDRADAERLLLLQGKDGGWDSGWIYKYGSTGIKIGNRGLTTALAINAIQASYSPFDRVPM